MNILQCSTTNGWLVEGGFEIYALGFGCWSLGFMAWGLKFEVHGLEFGVWSFAVQPHHERLAGEGGSDFK